MGVYFIFTENLSNIRIGETTAPAQRLSYIQRGEVLDLTMLYISGDQRHQGLNEEKLIKGFYQKFKQYEKRNGWFYFAEEIQQYVKDLEQEYNYELYGYKHSGIIKEIVNTSKAKENTIQARVAMEVKNSVKRPRGRPKTKSTDEIISKREQSRIERYERQLKEFVEDAVNLLVKTNI